MKFHFLSSEDISCRGDVGRRTSSPARTCDTDVDVPEMEMIYSETDDVTRDLSSMSVDEREEELCQLVINALFTIMWRGGNKSGALSDDVIKERGQVKLPFILKKRLFLPSKQIFVEFYTTFTVCQ